MSYSVIHLRHKETRYGSMESPPETPGFFCEPFVANSARQKLQCHEQAIFINIIWWYWILSATIIRVFTEIERNWDIGGERGRVKECIDLQVLFTKLFWNQMFLYKGHSSSVFQNLAMEPFVWYMQDSRMTPIAKLLRWFQLKLAFANQNWLCSSEEVRL